MYSYWILFFIPALLSTYFPRSRWPRWQLSLITTLLTFFIGLRHEVGGDWFNYIPYLTRSNGLQLVEILPWGDPGYNLLNWLFAPYSWGIYCVNLVCAVVFTVGLVAFCRAQPRPWLALTLAIPYLVIVVSMGYSRQGVAIGLIMPGLLALERGHLRSFLLLMAAAASFHSTALVMLAFVIPAVSGRTATSRVLRLLIFLTVGAALVQTFLTSRVDSLLSGYIEAEYRSEGAAIRVAMNLIPAAIFLSWPNRFGFSQLQSQLWRALSYTSIFCALALILLPSNSTAVDRVALYVIPLQLVIGSRLPDTHLLGIKTSHLTAAVLSFSFLVQFVWLNFASNSSGWLPYENLLFL